MRIILLVCCSLAAAASLSAQASEAPPRLSEVEEIVVTGTRLKLQDEIAAASLVILDEAKIEELGVATVGELLGYLPQAPYVFRDGFHLAGAQFAELRGLGVDTTLVLINGRRTVPSSANVAVNAFDLNTIPVSAIERIEVLSDSASAVYGADAVGGVVNVVLKRDLQRPVVEGRYGAAEGGGEERRAAFSGGVSGDRIHATLVLDYFEREPLLGRERERSADQDLRRYGGADWRVNTTNPANVSSRTTANLPGLPSRIAAVPVGSSGQGLRPADFLPTAGQQHLDSPLAMRSVVTEAERQSAIATLAFDASPAFAPFVEGMYVERTSRDPLNPATLTNARVPAANPFNPFGVDVSVNYSFDGLGPRERVFEQTLARGVAGARGLLGSWDWELAGLYTQEESESWIANSVDAARVAAALAATDPSAALNVFQDGPGGSRALLASLVAEPVTRIDSGGEQWTAFVRGPLFDLPAGEVQVVVGGERRHESVDFNDLVVLVEHTRTVDAAFAEMRLPLVSSEFDWPAMRELSFTLAGRQDRYSDFGDTFNPQYGVRWAPHRDLLFTATYGTSFRAPAVFELYSPRREIVGNVVVDPRRNGQQTSVRVISGGNPDLDPVEGESWTTGVVYRPQSLPAARFSASFWSVTLDGRVQIFSQQLVLTHESLFPDRVQRQAPTAADAALGLPGVIDAIDVSRINFGRMKTSGVDVAASYAVETAIGRFNADLSGVWIDEFTSTGAPGTPSVRRVGIAHLEGAIPRWRGVGTLGWSHGPLSFSTTVRHIDSYEDTTIVGVRTGRDVDAQTLVDACAAIDFAALDSAGAALDGLKASIGVTNVFDEAPPFAEIYALLGYDQSQGDLRQRFGYVQLSYQF